MIALPSDYGAGLESLYSGIDRQQQPSAIVKFVDPASFAYRGSGGTNWHEFFSDLSGAFIHKDENEHQIISIEEIQKIITDTFGITMDELANYCDTTRRSLYNWRRDVAPRDKSAKRLFTLYRVARDWQESGVGSPGPFRYEGVLNDKSLNDLLLEEDIDVDAIAFVRTRFELRALEERPIADPFGV